MRGDDNEPTGSLFERCVTRREMLLTSGGVLAGVMLAGCGGSQEQQGSQEQGGSREESIPPVAGNFVGTVTDFAGDTNAVPFVALVAAGAPEEGGGKREVRAYLCDGRGINEWFWGSAAGNDLELSSDEGARLEGSLSPEAANGSITLADGESFTFEANPATGAAGLYNVTFSEDGQVRGISEGGGQLEAQVADEPNEGGFYPITGAITAPDGPSFDFETLSDISEAGEARWIVLTDDRIKGAKNGLRTKSGGSGFTDPTPIG